VADGSPIAIPDGIGMADAVAEEDMPAGASAAVPVAVAPQPAARAATASNPPTDAATPVRPHAGVQKRRNPIRPVTRSRIKPPKTAFGRESFTQSSRRASGR
jgi:hypothetical protein